MRNPRNCGPAERWMQEALDGALPEAGHDRLERHLQRCARCRAVWEEYGRLAHVSAAWMRPDAPAGDAAADAFTSAVFARIDAAKAPVSRRPWQRAWFVSPGLLFSAGFALVTLLALWLGPLVWAHFGPSLPATLPPPTALLPPLPPVGDLGSLPGGLLDGARTLPQTTFGAWSEVTSGIALPPVYAGGILSAALALNLLFLLRARTDTRKAIAR